MFHIFENLRVCCIVTNTLIFLPIMRRVNVVNVHTSNAFNMHCNIILPSMPMFSKCSLSFRFPPPKHYMHFFSPLYTVHATCSALLIQLHSTAPITQYVELFITRFPPVPCQFLPLRPRYLPHHPVL